MIKKTLMEQRLPNWSQCATGGPLGTLEWTHTPTSISKIFFKIFNLMHNFFHKSFIRLFFERSLMNSTRDFQNFTYLFKFRKNPFGFVISVVEEFRIQYSIDK